MIYISISYLVGIGYLIKNELSFLDVILFITSPISMPIGLGVIIRKQIDNLNEKE